MIRISAYLLSSAIGSVIMFPQLIMFFFSFFYSCACHRARPIPTTRSLRRICRWTMNVKRSAGRPNAWPWPNSTRPEWVPFFFFCCAAKPTGIENNFLLSLSLPHSPFFFFLPPPRRAASGWRRDFCSFLPMILLLLSFFFFLPVCVFVLWSSRSFPLVLLTLVSLLSLIPRAASSGSLLGCCWRGPCLIDWIDVVCLSLLFPFFLTAFSPWETDQAGGFRREDQRVVRRDDRWRLARSRQRRLLQRPRFLTYQGTTSTRLYLFLLLLFFLFSPCTHKHEAYKRRLVLVSQSPPSLLAPLLSIHPHAGTIDPYYPPLASLSLSLAPCDGASSCSLIDEAPSRVPTAPYRLPLSLSGRV